MTRRLILIRHAKSSWDAPLDDHARTLNDRGRADADRIGGWLATNKYVPNVIYSSDAARTLETSRLIVAHFDLVPEICALDTLYHASPETLWSVLRQADTETIAIVAHNPGIAVFAETLVADAPAHTAFFNYPTGATLVCDLPIKSWAEAVPRSGQVVDFTVPKDLA